MSNHDNQLFNDDQVTNLYLNNDNKKKTIIDQRLTESIDVADDLCHAASERGYLLE